MKKLLLTVFIFLPLFLQSQIKTDTLYSGKKLYVDFSASKINSFNQQLSPKDICLKLEKINPEYKHLKLVEEGFAKAHIPFLLRSYAKIAKSNILLEYDAVIFSSYLDSEEFMNEIYLIEFFFETKNQAELCEKIIKNLILLRKEEEKKDDKILFGIYNWFCISKDNRVYLIHYMHNETTECPIVGNFSNKLSAILIDE